MADDLVRWGRQSAHSQDDGFVFASETMTGKQPCWPDNLMKRDIRLVARDIGINEKIGWRTFRYTFGTLLKANGDKTGGERTAAEDRGEPDDGTHYFEHWLATLEHLVTAKALSNPNEMLARKKAWADAYRHTPHGKPVELAAAKGAVSES